MAPNRQTAEALEEAIYREIGAFNFYSTMADRITNPGGKKKFMEIAEDEERHRDKLTSWFNKLSDTAFEVTEKKVEESEIQNVTLSEKIGAEKALDIAIEAELKATDFYENQAGRVSQKELRELYLSLAEEEKGHYNLLVAEKNALAGGFYWFDMDSTAFMED